MNQVTAGDVKAVAAKLKESGALAAERRAGEDALASRIASVLNVAFSRLPLDQAGELDDAQWASLPEPEREERYRELVRARDALGVLVEGDGPLNPRSLMYREYVSNFGVVVLSLFALIGTLAMLFAIHENWQRATERVCNGVPCTEAAPSGSAAIAPGPLEQDVLLMVMLMGALGGFIHLTSSVTKYIGNRQFLRSWIVYYLLMPLEGAGLAVTVYLMVRVGVLNPAASNQSATKNLNWVGIYAMSALAGLFSKQALETLGDLFNTLFRRTGNKDGVSKPK